MKKDYMKWQELHFSSEDYDWKNAKKITAGIDVGTTSTQAVIFCDETLFAYASIHTAPDYTGAGEAALRKALEGTGMTRQDIGCICSTGYGYDTVNFADKHVDEVHCHGTGARYMFGPSVNTILDLGGQTVKAIRMYEWDRVRDIMIGDKCATGMGRNIETFAAIAEIPLEELGAFSLSEDRDPEPCSTTCYVFSLPEAIGMLRPEFRADPLSARQVVGGYLFSVAWRALGVLGKLSPLDPGAIKIDGDLAFTGGLAKNIGITKRIERELSVTAAASKYDPMLAGAIGAALLAQQD